MHVGFIIFWFKLTMVPRWYYDQLEPEVKSELTPVDDEYWSSGCPKNVFCRPDIQITPEQQKFYQQALVEIGLRNELGEHKTRLIL